MTDHRTIVETDAVAAALLDHLAARRGLWRGTAAQLLAELSSRVTRETACGHDWPKTASRLGRRLAQIAPALCAAANIEAVQARSRPDGAKIWTSHKI